MKNLFSLGRFQNRPYKRPRGGNRIPSVGAGFKPALYIFAALLFFAPALLHAQVTTSMQVPLAGTVFVPLSDGSFDEVALSGMVHVFTYFRTPPVPQWPSDPMRIHINLDQVSGVGKSTGLRYIGTGAFRINLPAQPQDPMRTSFDLRAAGAPPDPVIPMDPIVPLDISFDLTFNPDTGQLTNVTIESMSVPEP